MPTLADVLRGYTPPTESALADPIKQHLASLPQKFEENQRNQMDLLARAYPGNTYESMMTQGDPKALAELGMQTPFNAMIAYHGTPHNILGKFDISKVGTGEGAQAYGHGMYFAEAPEVAKQYQAALSSPKYKVGEKELKGNDAWAAQFLHSFQDDALPKRIDVDTAIKSAKNVFKSNKTEAEIINKIKELDKAGVTVENGNLYKVDIPDEYIPNMLDWDKPLKDQPQIVEMLKTSKNKDIKKMLSNLDSFAGSSIPPAGKNLLSTLGFYPDNPKKAAKLLDSLGIKGVRYLDEGSRNAGKGTSNFVVFDPSEVKILEKNNQPVSRKELIEEQINKLKD
mgnify:CR=1 FL=1